MIMGSDLEIEGEKILFGNRILKANGLLNGNLDRFQGTPPNQAVFSGRDMLIRDINRFVGLDLENLVASASTAFQANLIAESQQKQVNVWLKNRDMAMQDVEDKLKDTIKTYFPLDLPFRIVDSLTDMIPETPQIEVSGKTYKKGKFTPSKNETVKTVIDIDADMLAGDYAVDVTTSSQDTSSGVIKKAQMLDYVRAIPEVMNGYMIAKQAGMESVISPQEILDELAKVYNVPQKDKTANADLKDKAAELKAQLLATAQKV